MLNILPLASSFHAKERVQAAVLAISRNLASRSLEHTMIAEGEATPSALLIVTGGTEHLALKALEEMPGPALLMAHPDQNSLPASLEILCLLRQRGRSGRIVLLNESEHGYEELANFAKLQATWERMQGLRLGRIGKPSDWLVGSLPDAAIVKRAWGPELVDVDLEALRKAIAEVNPAEAQALCRSVKEKSASVMEPTDADLMLASRVTAALRKVVRDHDLDACSVRCFDLVLELKTTGCLALATLLDEGMVAGCEGDVPATLTMLWMQAMTGQISFMANPQDMNLSDNTLWLAHCTIARSLVKSYALRSHFESSLGVGIQGELEPGPITLARIGGTDLRGLFLADGELLGNGASENRCRTQVQVCLDADLNELLQRPMGNHHVLLRGHWAQQLRDYHAFFIA